MHKECKKKMDFCYTNYYYYFCYVKASRIHKNKQTEKKKIENNMLPSIWRKCMELILPLDEKSSKEEEERKGKKYMCKVLNLDNIYNNCNTERNYDKIVETLYKIG